MIYFVRFLKYSLPAFFSGVGFYHFFIGTSLFVPIADIEDVCREKGYCVNEKIEVVQYSTESKIKFEKIKDEIDRLSPTPTHPKTEELSDESLERYNQVSLEIIFGQLEILDKLINGSDISGITDSLQNQFNIRFQKFSK